MRLLSDLLEESKKFPYFCLLNSNGYDDGFEDTLVYGSSSVDFNSIDNDCYGILTYDLKDRFFRGLREDSDKVIKVQVDTFFKKEKQFSNYHNDINFNDNSFKSQLNIKPAVGKDEYISNVKAIQKDIHNGLVYELNYCIPFIAENVSIDPLSLYQKLNFLSPVPFSALLKLNNQWVISASPERFMKKKGGVLLSQPIKGTIKRDFINDEHQKKLLLHSEKERAENLMIVDLVRNDLNRICNVGSVHVDELFGIYTFPQVHQMISTVSGKIDQGINFQKIIKASFPMGSMTGAPKKKALDLISFYEKCDRGYFSGAIGGVNTKGDFDFNVVIRSIIYDQEISKLFFMVGSAITFDSDPAEEYEECLLKASAINKSFE